MEPSYSWVLIEVNNHREYKINKPVFAVGRNLQADLVLHHLGASRNHCKIFTIQDSSLLIQDLGTVNGTYINDVKIAAREMTAIKEGDSIMFGGREEGCFYKLSKDVFDLTDIVPVNSHQDSQTLEKARRTTIVIHSSGNSSSSNSVQIVESSDEEQVCQLPGDSSSRVIEESPDSIQGTTIANSCNSIPQKHINLRNNINLPLPVTNSTIIKSKESGIHSVNENISSGINIPNLPSTSKQTVFIENSNNSTRHKEVNNNSNSSASASKSKLIKSSINDDIPVEINETNTPSKKVNQGASSVSDSKASSKNTISVKNNKNKITNKEVNQDIRTPSVPDSKAPSKNTRPVENIKTKLPNKKVNQDLRTASVSDSKESSKNTVLIQNNKTKLPKKNVGQDPISAPSIPNSKPSSSKRSKTPVSVSKKTPSRENCRKVRSTSPNCSTKEVKSRPPCAPLLERRKSEANISDFGKLNTRGGKMLIILSTSSTAEPVSIKTKENNSETLKKRRMSDTSAPSQIPSPSKTTANINSKETDQRHVKKNKQINIISNQIITPGESDRTDSGKRQSTSTWSLNKSCEKRLSGSNLSEFSQESRKSGDDFKRKTKRESISNPRGQSCIEEMARNFTEICPSTSSHLDQESNNNQDNRFSTGNQSLIIEIDDDDEDQDDIACSQMAVMSQKVKIETDRMDDRHKIIKNEIEDMDYCEKEIILNKEPYDLSEDLPDNELMPFNSTQDIMDILEGNGNDDQKDDSENQDVRESLMSPDDELMQILNSVIREETNSNEKGEKKVVHEGCVKDNTRSKTPLIKRKYMIPPIVDPHTERTNKSKTGSEKTKKPDDPKETDRKRKLSIEHPCPKKQKTKEDESDLSKRKSDKVGDKKSTDKARSSVPRKPWISRSKSTDSKCSTKYIQEELKRRNVTKLEVGKSTKQSIKEERMMKLKELSDRGSNHKREPTVDKVKTTPKVKISSGRGIFLTEPESSASHKRIQTRSSISMQNSDKTLPDSHPEVSSNYNLRNKRRSTPTRSNTPSLLASSNCSTPSPSRLIVPNLASKLQFPKFDLPNNVEAPIRLNGNLPTRVTRNGMQKNISNSPGNTNVDDVIQHMVRWLPNWLEEQGRLSQTAPVNGDKPAVPLALNFESFQQYWDSMSPLIMLEAWQHIYSTFLSSRKLPHRSYIRHTRIVGQLMHMDCQCYITEEAVMQNNVYKTDDFLLLEYKLLRSDEEIEYKAFSFGFVKSCTRDVVRDNSIVCDTVADLCPGKLHTRLDFTVVTMWRPGIDKVSSPVLLSQLIANVGIYLKFFKTVKGLKCSSIGGKILKPRIYDFKGDAGKKAYFGMPTLNKEQKQIVLEASNICLGNDPKIYCIKGPPGTGKSTVIVNIIIQNILSQIIRGHANPVMLVTAPSNAAIDELALKILDAKKELGGDKRRHIKLVRLGVDANISDAISNYKLHEHILREMIMAAQCGESDEYKTALANGMDKATFLKKKMGQNAFTYEYYRQEEVMLRGCNIICTTLTSCVNLKLSEAVRKGFVNFKCCIIDEATQCTEVQSLLPTHLGIQRFILVGDPKQLPATVISMEAKNLGFEQSLFSRIARNFEKDPRNPIRMLREQYRMHKEICSFPNRCFYDGKLRSSPYIPNPIRPRIRPYLVFTITETRIKEDDDDQYVNMDEVDMVKKILTTLFELTDKSCKYSVGIITPYTAQKNIIDRSIYELRLRQNVSIVVNTVDGFQGMEKDIIIISCVRDDSNNFVNNQNRLNVALTRAKQALYIVCSHSLFKDCQTLYDLREDAKRRNLCLDIKDKPSSISNLKKYILQR